MIELLLQAERTLAAGRIDEAERLYRQAASADPLSSIAVVGLARVALERGDDTEAWRLGRRALEIDPENVAAQRLTQRLDEVYTYRGESIAALAAMGEPASAIMDGPGPVPAAATSPPEPASPPAPSAANVSPPPATSAPNLSPPPATSAPAPGRGSRSLVDRVFRRKPR